MARCPECECSLSATLHEGVELSLCDDCGGIWATFAQLEELKCGPVPVKVLKGKTTRRCASCRLTLSKARLPGDLPVEACTTCRGVFFEAGTLQRFAPSRAGLHPTGGGATFQCVACRKTLPLARGTALRGGLGCRECAGIASGQKDPAADLATTPSLTEFLVSGQGMLIVIIVVAIIALLIAGSNYIWLESPPPVP